MYTRQIYYKQISPRFRFRNMFQKPAVLNIIFWENCLWCSNILIKLRSWREAVISPKTEFMLSLSKEALKILMYLQKNFLGGSFLVEDFISYPCNFIKMDSATEIFWQGFCKIVLFEDIFAISFLTKFQTSIFRLQLYGKWHLRNI